MHHPKVASTAARVILLFSALTPAAAAQPVNCSNPDNLCTGNPCVIAANIEVQSPCVADFSPRTLKIDGRIHVPSAGVLEFTAGAIEVNGRVSGRHQGAGKKGASVKLASSAGLTVKRRIDVAGNTPGSIILDAGSDLVIRGGLSREL